MLHLSAHYTYPRLLAFTLPSMGMMLAISLYTVVDGFFVANFVGKDALAAITILFPLLGILGSVGFMFGTGGAALVGKLLGQGQTRCANATFSLLFGISLGSGIVLSLLGEWLLVPLLTWFGAQGAILTESLCYGRIALLSLPGLILQFFFQPFFVTAEKPSLGFWVTIAAGCTNIVLDALLLCGLEMGVAGAAIATAASEYIGGFLPLCFFAKPHTDTLCLQKPLLALAPIGKAALNGCAEFCINVCFPLQMVIYNQQLLQLAGEDGVAAYGVLLYVAYVFLAILLGYAVGSAPLISYNFGAKNMKELRNIFDKSLVFNLCAGLFLTLFLALLAAPIARLFTGYDPTLCRLTQRAILFLSPLFVFASLNIYGASFFTAMNNGILAATISCLRTLVFGVLPVFVLPLFWGLDGVWLAWSSGEILTLAITIPLLGRIRTNTTKTP